MKEIRIPSSLPPMEKPTDKPRGSGQGNESFGEVLKTSIEEVNRLQVEANHAIEQLGTGETKNIHETMIALEKAEISFKLMLEVRNKILDAYREVMRMNV
jgi:flagellar hook-basal body complex protein FliE